jgi:Protein of unknown function (DUF3866)
MLSLRRGRVTAVVERQEGLARVEVDGTPCVAYPSLTGPVALGDDVVVNVQARTLELGSGGFDILYANLTRGLELPSADAAHVMKLPYTPVQHAALHGEESVELPKALDGMPVVACSLHSQVVPVCAALAGLRVTYVQVPGGALPLALSDALRALERRELVGTTIAAGACFGGDLEAVNVYSALLLACAEEADVAVCAVGPGIVGTATPLGHGGMASADSLVAARRLGGRAVLTLRMSEGDLRGRHRGLSHHSEAVLALVGEGCHVAWPKGCPFERPSSGDLVELDVADWRNACKGLPLEHMGRGPSEDPWFFAAAYAAGRLARELLEP